MAPEEQRKWRRSEESSYQIATAGMGGRSFSRKSQATPPRAWRWWQPGLLRAKINPAWPLWSAARDDKISIQSGERKHPDYQEKRGFREVCFIFQTSRRRMPMHWMPMHSNNAHVGGAGTVRSLKSEEEEGSVSQKTKRLQLWGAFPVNFLLPSLNIFCPVQGSYSDKRLSLGTSGCLHDTKMHPWVLTTGQNQFVALWWSDAPRNIILTRETMSRIWAEIQYRTQIFILHLPVFISTS